MLTRPNLGTNFRPYTMKDVRKSSSRNLFTVVSTFCGGGGSSTGYKLAGGNVLLAVDSDRSAIETYRHNYPDTPTVLDDIRNISRLGSDKKILSFFNKFGIEQGELDILDGSPPCTAFSIASRNKDRDKDRTLNNPHSDKKNTSNLMGDFIKLVSCLRPKIFIMENVVPSKNSTIFKVSMDKIRNEGYLINWQTVISSDCGVAQSRKRLIVIGIRGDVAVNSSLMTDEDILDLYPVPCVQQLTVRDVISDLVTDPEEEDILLDTCRLSTNYELLKLIPKSPIKPSKIYHIHPDWERRFNSDFTLIRSSWNHPCPTITCRGQQLGISGIHHPDHDRKFTISELKRLTSLPDDFHITGTFNDKVERIGNMVPPFMTRSLSSNIHKEIFSK